MGEGVSRQKKSCVKDIKKAPLGTLFRAPLIAPLRPRSSRATTFENTNGVLWDESLEK